MSMALPATVHEQGITPQTTYDEPAVVDLHGLSVTFGRRPILKNLRGDLRGKAIGLLGPNGAGKTTLIHTLLGFHEPSAGTAQIFGHDIVDDAKKIKSLIGYMPERDSFIAKMSAVHFVRFELTPARRPRALRDERPVARDPLDEPFLHQPLDGAAGGHAAHPELLAEHGVGGKGVARPELCDPIAKRLLDRKVTGSGGSLTRHKSRCIDYTP